MDPISVIALSLGAGWASGLNLYAAVLTLGLLQDLGWVNLPPDLQVLGSPVVLTVVAVLYLVEFFADKVPGVSTAWNALHTFIRIPAGALLAAASVAGVDPDWALAAALIGGSVAAGTHAAKTGSRFALAMLPLPLAGMAISLGEDAAAVAIVWLALSHPIVLLVMLGLFVALLIWFLPRLFRLLRRMVQTVARWFSGAKEPAAR